MQPEDLKYNPSHEWVSISEENNQKIATVGISSFAIQQLTDLVYMALPKVGAQVTAGSEFGEVESVKAVSPLYSPVTGEVIEVHDQLVDQLETLGDDPYGHGWIVKVKVTDDTSLSELLDYDAYQRQCAEV
jgi:glycine cleavage system H protein